MPRLPLLPRELDDSSDSDDEPLIPSLERPDDPLMPESWLTPRDDELEPALRLELLEPDEALMPPLFELSPDVERSWLDEVERSLLDDEDDPFDDALSPPWPERSCELPRPELVLPEAPRPSLRLLLSPMLLELRSLPLVLRSLEPADELPERVPDAP